MESATDARKMDAKGVESPSSITPYKKREFCNNIKCPVQLELNKHIDTSSEYNAIKGICASNCLQSADSFLIWLKNNKYYITNNDKESSDTYIDKIETLAKFENTAWRFHRAINQQGFMILKK